MFLLMVCFFFVFAQPVYAVAFVIPVVCMAAVAAVGLAAGVTYATDEGMRGWCQTWWSNAKEDVRLAISDFVSAGGGTGDLFVSPAIWANTLDTREALRNGFISSMEYEGAGMAELYSFVATSRGSGAPDFLPIGDYIGTYVFTVHSHFSPANSGYIYGKVPGSSGGSSGIGSAVIRVYQGTGNALSVSVSINDEWVQVFKVYGSENIADLTFTVECTGSSTIVSSGGNSIALLNPYNLTGHTSITGIDLSVYSSAAGTYTVPVDGCCPAH